MKSLRLLGYVALGGLALFIASASFNRIDAQVRPPFVMPKWEYKIVHSATEPSFNELGKEGWELSAAVGPYPTNNVPVTFVFKRRAF